MTDADSQPPLPDLLVPSLALVFCGINPGMRAASTGHHFEGRGNRFWRVMHLAGFTPEQIRPEDDRTVLRYGCGLTTVVPRPTAQAANLSRSEIELAGDDFRRKIEHYAPRNIAFLGKMALSAISRAHYRLGFAKRAIRRCMRMGLAQFKRTEPGLRSRFAGGRLLSLCHKKR